MIKKSKREKKPDQITDGESVYFRKAEAELCDRLTAVLRDYLRRSGIPPAEQQRAKSGFFKILMGLRGYETVHVTSEHREFLAGIREGFTEWNEPSNRPLILRDGISPKDARPMSGRRKIN